MQHDHQKKSFWRLPQVSAMSDDLWWLDPPRSGNEATDAVFAGLSSAEARQRLRQYGLNRLPGHEADSWLKGYLRRFESPLVIVLLVASVLSAVTGEIADFIIIGTIVLLSVSLDFVQEHRANTAAAKLRQTVAVKASVVRDGTVVEIDVASVVPGDVVVLKAGNLVPADGFVLKASDFFVKQALLTGESYPVEKHPGALAKTATGMSDAANAVFMGTSVISGSARMLVMRTGAATAIGEIAASIVRPVPPTSFDIGTRRFGLLIMRLASVMVLFVLLVNAWFQRPWLESFLFAIALAVGLTPELLPMVISVTLARGAVRMATKRVIVKRLTAIQDLGSMDVLCTDKTGTLTQARIVMARHIDAEGQSSERVLHLAYLNSYFESGLKTPLDEAILDRQPIEVEAWTKIDEVPFDFERRCVSVLLDNGTERWLVVKGAADHVVGLCSHYEREATARPQPIDGTVRQVITDRFHALEADGFRVLGIAWRAVSRDHPHAQVADEASLVLAGFAAFLDPPKASAASALDALKHAGVAIKIVTGDSDLVTTHVCGELGIPVTGLLTGEEIEQLDDHALRIRVEQSNLFCRVNPAQKNRVILALKARGHVVGYLGDGINDAPSLHSADVGLSVDSAVDVAKEAADMILLRHDLHVLHAAVLEGRRTFGNIMKYLMMGTSSNFGNMFSMAGASLLLPFLPMLPTQILLNNILYDISELPIPFDQVDSEDLASPRVLDLGFIRNFMLVIGPISSLFDFLTFFVLLSVLHAGDKVFQTGWFVESLCTQVLVIFVIRTRGSFLRSRAHPLLTMTSILVVMLAILLPLTPLGGYFGFVPLPLHFYLILGGMVVLYLLAVEVAKRAFYRWQR